MNHLSQAEIFATAFIIRILFSHPPLPATSSDARVSNAKTTWLSVLAAKYRTEPSHIKIFIPPGWSENMGTLGPASQTFAGGGLISETFRCVWPT